MRPFLKEVTPVSFLLLCNKFPAISPFRDSKVFCELRVWFYLELCQLLSSKPRVRWVDSQVFGCFGHERILF